jgi:hypothetical protein
LIAIGGPPAITTAPKDVGHETRKITVPHCPMDAFFGASVALCGDIALVGCPQDGFPPSKTGAAYLFHVRGRKPEVEKLSAIDARDGDRFGSSVALTGSTALIGAPNAQLAGAAYVFQLGGVQSSKTIARLTASDAIAGDQFGHSVSIDGDLALVGSPRKHSGKPESGAAYLFQQDGQGQWQEVAKLTADDVEAFKGFGWSVAISGQTAFIGAYGDNAAGPLCGAVYVFQCDASGRWISVAKLTAADATAFAGFGWSLAVDDDTAVIGAYADSAGETGLGAVYVFHRDAADSWRQVAKLSANDAVEGDRFGYSVSVSGESIAVGSPIHNHCSGAVYVFRVDPTGKWRRFGKYLASDSRALDWFGAALAMSGDALLVGANRNDDVAPNAGSAYVVELDHMP